MESISIQSRYFSIISKVNTGIIMNTCMTTDKTSINGIIMFVILVQAIRGNTNIGGSREGKDNRWEVGDSLRVAGQVNRAIRLRFKTGLLYSKTRVLGAGSR